MKNAITLIAVLLLIGFTAPIHADIVNPLRSQGDYNVIVFGSFEQKDGWGADIEGNVAIRGNAKINNGFTFNGIPGKSQYAPAGLVVGGAIQGSNISYQGAKAYYGPESNTNHNGQPFWHNNNSGGQKEILKENPIDFGKLRDNIKEFSDGIANLDTTDGVSTLFNKNNREIHLDGSGQHVINIYLSDWYEMYNSTTIDALYVFGQSDAELLINIIGNDMYDEVTFTKDVTMKNGIKSNNVLINLVGIETMYNLNNSTIYANVLGYDTDLIMAGTIDGTGVFNDVTMTGNSEFHANNRYEGGIDPGPPGATVPEPASILIFGLGLGALPFVKRLRKKSA